MTLKPWSVVGLAVMLAGCVTRKEPDHIHSFQGKLTSRLAVVDGDDVALYDMEKKCDTCGYEVHEHKWVSAVESRLSKVKRELGYAGIDKQ